MLITRTNKKDKKVKNKCGIFRVGILIICTQCWYGSKYLLKFPP